MSLKSILLGLSFLFASSLSFAATYKVTNSNSSGKGSLRWAVEQANNNPGADTVEVPGSFDANNPIVPGTASRSGRYTLESPILITDDITIKGLGSSRPVIDDHQHWITTAGLTNVGYPFDTGPSGGGATILKPVGTLFRVNRANGAGRTLDVRIENLAFTRMSTFINTDNANVTLDNIAIYGFVCQRSSDLLILHGLGGSLTIKDSLIFNNLVNNGEQHIVVNNDLTIINSAFSANSNGALRVATDRLISMTDNTSKNVIIRDSYFDGLDSSALEFKNASVEITNSVFDGRDATPTRAIKVTDGDLTLTNSTLYFTPKTTNNTGDIFQGTHIELAGSAQLIARNNLLLSTDSSRNTFPVIYPSNWDDTGVYARAVNDNNYISRINGDDSTLNLFPLKCVNASLNRNCFVPNASSTPLVDQGNTADALYGDGSPISEDFLGELRAQGASVDIGAYEKHETLYAHADHYQTNEGVNLIVSSANGVLANDSTPGGLNVSLKTQALHGSVTLNPDGSFDYMPNNGYYGQDQFEYELSGKAAYVTIDVVSTGWLSIPNNQQPTASPDSFTIHERETLTRPAPGLLINDSDDQNNTPPLYLGLEARLHKGPIHGTVTINLDGSFTYIPDPGYTGSDEFFYDAIDSLQKHSPPTKVTVQINSGARAGAEIKVATKAGSVGLATLLALLALFVGSYLISKRNKYAQSVLLVCAVSFMTSLHSTDAHADELQSDSAPQPASKETHEDQFFEGFIADLSFGYSNLEPEAPSNIWTQNRDHGAAFAVGAGYQFTDQLSTTLRYYDFHTINLNSSDSLYDDVSIEYRVLELSGTYRFTQLWGSQFAPLVLGGIGYLDPKIKGDTDSVTTEEDYHLAYGVGISLSPMKHGMFDLVWQSMAGDVDLISLRLTLDVPN